MWTVAHEKTEPTMMFEQAASMNPTVQTCAGSRRAGKPTMQGPSPHVPDPNLLEALGHIQYRAPALAMLRSLRCLQAGASSALRPLHAQSCSLDCVAIHGSKISIRIRCRTFSNVPSVNVLISHNFRKIRRALATSKAVLMSGLGHVHRGSFFAAVPYVLPSVLLPLPMRLQQLCHHHLKVLTTDAINTSHVQLLAAFRLLLLLQTKNNIRGIPLRIADVPAT